MPSLAPLAINVEPFEDARLIRAVGEIDLGTANALRAELDSAHRDATAVLLDLSGVTFIDSTGLQLLLEASENSAVGDWAFALVRPSTAVQRLIEVSGTADLFPVLAGSAIDG
jgi:anti-anti-sigma factor